MFQQRQRVGDHFVHIHIADLASAGAREIQQIVHDLRGAESLPRDLFQQARLLRIALQLLAQHLRVGGDHGQRSVDFVSHAGRQQSDGRKFVGLRKLGFKFDALGDVIHDDQPADDLELARHQRRERHIHGADFTRGRLQAEFVQVANARFLPHAIEFFDELRRENGFQRLGQSLPARHRVHHFHLRVPALDAVFHVERHHAHVDGFDDVFVEVLQALVFRRLLLQRGIELPF